MTINRAQGKARKQKSSHKQWTERKKKSTGQRNSTNHYTCENGRGDRKSEHGKFRAKTSNSHLGKPETRRRKLKKRKRDSLVRPPKQNEAGTGQPIPHCGLVEKLQKASP